MLPVLLAITGAPWETEFVGRLGDGSRAATADVVVVRRCVDVADLLATASTGVASAALVWPGLHRLDGEVIGDLTASGVAVVAVVGPDDPTDLAGRFGPAAIVPAESTIDRLASVVAEAVRQASVGGRVGADTAHPGSLSADDTTVDHHRSVDRASMHGDAEAEEAASAHGRGSLVAVWGPTGAPGRTSIAVALAGELARLDSATLLADADVYGGTVAEVLGIVDEPPGLAAAVRAAHAGSLGISELATVARAVAPNLRVLTGLVRGDRWPELRPRPLRQVWDMSRQIARVTVVDCGFCLEQDEEISFDVGAPRRNGATLETLAAADIVCAVVAADPIGVIRFAHVIDDLRAAAPAASLRVVVNQVRRGPVGRAPEAQLSDAIERHTGLRPAAFIPYDRAAFDAVLAAGRMLADVAPGSPARVAVQAFARSLIGLPAVDGRRRRRRRTSLVAR